MSVDDDILAPRSRLLAAAPAAAQVRRSARPDAAAAAVRCPIDMLRADSPRRAGSDIVYFGGGTAQLVAARRRPTLAAQARWLRQHPEVAVRIEGHADRGDTRDHALAIGERRAEAVRDFSDAAGRARGAAADHQLGQGAARGAGQARPRAQPPVTADALQAAQRLRSCSLPSQARAWRWASAISRAVISIEISARHCWPRVQPDKRREVEPFVRFDQVDGDPAAAGRIGHSKLEQRVDIAALRRRQCGCGSGTPRLSG